MAGAAIVHDMSIDSNGHMARDAAGNIWLTMVGTNQMGTLHPESGEVAFYDTNTIDGLSPINHLIYSTVLSADGKHAWYSQVNGSVGCIDTRTKKIAKLIAFPEGTGPRRMTRDNSGPSVGCAFRQRASGPHRHDHRLRSSQTFDLPDRASAPYAVTWDERRKVVWVANANCDAIYRLDPRSGADHASIRCRGRWPTCARSRSTRHRPADRNLQQLSRRFGAFDGRADRRR